MLLLFVLASLGLAVSAAPSTSCIAMDANWNLLAFNLGGKDYNAGTQDNWASGSPKQLATDGRPPYSGQNVTCHFSQFSNAVYITGADSSNPTDIYIYDASDDSWSTQAVNAPDDFDSTSLVAILDHDTNVFYGMSKGTLYSLQIGDTLSKATDNTQQWQAVSSPPWSTEGYEPVMGLALNHVHFLNVPDVDAGSAEIFVIHFAYWQPEIQPFGDFPASHGQTASMFLEEGAQLEFAFIPDSGENTYIINVETNITTTFPGPSMQDPWASYFGSPDSLVQLTSSGAVNYMPYSNGPSATSVSWSPVEILAQAAPPSTTSGSQASPTGAVTGNSENGENAASANGPGSLFAFALTTLVLMTSAGGLLFY